MSLAEIFLESGKVEGLRLMRGTLVGAQKPETALEVCV